MDRSSIPKGSRVAANIIHTEGTLIVGVSYMDGPQMVVTETSPDGRRVVSYWTKQAEIDDVQKR